MPTIESAPMIKSESCEMSCSINSTENQPISYAQLQNYMNWINAQLKKRPGVKLVENLQNDVSNGVPLIHLIEIFSGYVFPDVKLNPSSTNDCKENIEKVLKFMQNNSIKMQRTSPKDILDGNSKAIMRVVLALAAHYKPTNLHRPQTTTVSASCLPSTKTVDSNLNKINSNKMFTHSASNLQVNRNSASSNIQTTEQNTKSNLNQTRTIDSMTHLIQAACVNFSDIRRYKNENFNVKYVKRNNLNPTPTPPPPLLPPPPPPPLSSTEFTSKLNKTITIESASKLVEPKVNKINNETYVAHTGSMFKSPLKADFKPTIVKPSPVGDFSFSHSMLNSPSSQLPLASSTILLPFNSETNGRTSFLNSSLKFEINSQSNEKNNNKTYNLKENTPSKATSIKKENDHETYLSAKQNNENTKINSSSSSSSCSNTIQNTTNGETKTFKANENAIEIEDLKSKTDQNSNHDYNQNNSEDQAELIDDVQGVKNTLLRLQSLLMKGNLNELFANFESNPDQNDNLNKFLNQECDVNTSTDSNEEFALSSMAPDEQVAILRSKIQQLEILSTDLRNELNQAKAESMQTIGVQSGLKSRLEEQNNTILEMKNEQLNLHLTNKQLLKEKDHFRIRNEESMNQVNSLKKELSSRDDKIEKFKIQIDELTKETEQIKYLKLQVKQLTEAVNEVQEHKNKIEEMVVNTDLKLGRAIKNDATFIINKNDDRNHNNHSSLGLNVKQNSLITHDESALLRNTLNQLRKNTKQNLTSSYLIDTLESSLSKILERSSLLENSQNGINTVNIGGGTANLLLSSSANSSNSSSLTSSSANSPVLSSTNNVQSPTSQFSPSSSMSSNVFTSIFNSNPAARFNNPVNHITTSLDKQSVNTNLNLKRSTDSILSMKQFSGHVNRNKQNNYDDLVGSSRIIQNNNLVKNTEINNEQGTVKKMVSRFLAQSGSSNLNIVPSLQTTQSKRKIENDYEKFVNPSVILPLSKQNQHQQQQQQRTGISASNLLTISSSNNSSSTTVSSVHSPTSSNAQCLSSSSSSSTSSSSSSISNLNNSNTTKCVYYVNKDNTPYMTTINKNLNSISLNDFKEKLKLNSSHNYKFFFKSHEPEFGFLKEEISNDDTLLPCFESRIVAWVQEIL